MKTKKDPRGGARKGSGAKKSGVESKHISFFIPKQYGAEIKAECMPVILKYRELAKLGKI